MEFSLRWQDYREVSHMSANAIAWLGNQIAWETRLTQLRVPTRSTTSADDDHEVDKAA